MTDIRCIKGVTSARQLSVSAVSQEALDLTDADSPVDVPCALLMMTMQSGQHYGAKLTFSAADALARHLANIVAEHVRGNGREHAVSPPRPVRPDMAFGQRLHQLRNERQMSQRELASIVRCSCTVISEMELGKRIYSDAMVSRIAVALEASQEELVSHARRERPKPKRRGRPLKASRRETA